MTKNLILNSDDDDKNQNSKDDDEGYDDDGGGRSTIITDKEPVVVAQKIHLLWDDSTLDGEKTKAASPVHSINRLSSQVSKIRHLHKQRQSLTRQLQMAQTRLDMASQGWEDHDGIGSIRNVSLDFHDSVSSSSLPSSVKATEEKEDSTTLTTIASSSTPMQQPIIESYDDCDAFDERTTAPQHNVSLTTTLPSSTALRCLNELDNFGLGFTQSAIVDLDAITTILISDVLRPYFSSSLIETEEFYYESFSWVALSSVQLYCTLRELEDAMFHTTRTSERLDIVYHAQIRHKQDLVELGRRKEQELLDCGEECTDIF
jgi:hypothetical protein